MPVLELEYTGKDLVISKELAEKTLGLRFGDKLLVRPKPKLVPVERSPEEIAAIQAVLDELAGSWSDEDVKHFNKLRKELWATWKLPESV